ncbi:MAG: GHKL domain-containing protein [Oscillibacter sp.]
MTPLKVLCYFISTAVSYCVYLQLVCTSFQSALRYSKRRTRLIVTLGYCVGFAFDILFFEIDAPLHPYTIAGTVVITVLDIAGAILLFKKDPLKIFLGVFIILTMHNGFIAIATQMLGLNLLPILAPGFPNLNYLVYLLAAQLLFLPLLWYLFYKLLRRAVETDLDIALWRVLLYYIYGIATGISGARIEPASPQLLVTTVLRTLFGLASYVGALKLLLYACEKTETHYRVAAAEQQLSMAQDRYEILTQHMRETDRLLHDLRHHMLSFRDFADRGDLAGLNAYLDRMGEIYKTRDVPSVCARPTVDVVLRHYLGIAVDAGIEVQHQVQIPLDFGRSDLDLCVVFGNLTENALEACLRQTEGRNYISVSTECIGGKMLAIRIENSFSGTVSEKNGLFQSSKRKGPGLGLASVKSVAEQNGGSFRVSAEAGVFAAEILLNT